MMKGKQKRVKKSRLDGMYPLHSPGRTRKKNRYRPQHSHHNRDQNHCPLCLIHCHSLDPSQFWSHQFHQHLQQNLQSPSLRSQIRMLTDQNAPIIVPYDTTIMSFNPEDNDEIMEDVQRSMSEPEPKENKSMKKRPAASSERLKSGYAITPLHVIHT